MAGCPGRGTKTGPSPFHPLFDIESAEAERQVLGNRSLGLNGRNGAQNGLQTLGIAP